jgi:hypothetical protein
MEKGTGASGFGESVGRQGLDGDGEPATGSKAKRQLLSLTVHMRVRVSWPTIKIPDAPPLGSVMETFDVPGLWKHGLGRR